MNKDIYAIFLDIDGTVMVDGLKLGGDAGRGVVPPINIKVIKKARELGHKVFINTGRAYGFVPRELLDTLDVDGVVCGSGACIVADGKVVYSSTVPNETVRTVVRKMYGTGLTILVEGETRNLVLKLKDGQDVGEYTPETLTDEVLDKCRVSKITFAGLIDEEQNEYLSRYFNVCRQPTYTEASQKHCSKSNGMKKVIEYLGVDISHCIAMGDSANDTDMLENAGISVAMGNALDSIKAIADYVSEDAAEGGVANAILKYIPEVADALK